MTLEVGSSGVSNLELKLPPPVKLKGRFISNEGSPRLPNASVGLT